MSPFDANFPYLKAHRPGERNDLDVPRESHFVAIRDDARPDGSPCCLRSTLCIDDSWKERELDGLVVRAAKQLTTTRLMTDDARRGNPARPNRHDRVSCCSSDYASQIVERSGKVQVAEASDLRVGRHETGGDSGPLPLVGLVMQTKGGITMRGHELLDHLCSAVRASVVDKDDLTALRVS